MWLLLIFFSSVLSFVDDDGRLKFGKYFRRGGGWQRSFREQPSRSMMKSTVNDFLLPTITSYYHELFVKEGVRQLEFVPPDPVAHTMARPSKCISSLKGLQ